MGIGSFFLHRWLCLVVVIFLFAANGSLFAAQNPPSPLDRYPEIKQFFPDLTRVGKLSGNPLAAPVYKNKRLLGYVFLTNDIKPIPAYSGKPINTLIGLDVKGRITGARVVEHYEPILLVGISEEQLEAYINQYVGLSVFDRIRVGGETGEGQAGIDTISGATITVMVANASITGAGEQVAVSRNLPLIPRPSVQSDKHKPVAQRPIVSLDQAEDEPMWVFIWKERAFQIVVLLLALFVLLMIMMFQDWIMRRHVFYARVRMTYLFFTVFFIGWYALAQLSIVNVFTFVRAIFKDFHWETFALDPLMFILWSFVALTLILWGRGVYCGWLCPFGALQELINHFSRRLKIRQWEFPFAIHERLWAVKYMILIALFGVSLGSLAQAEQLAEIEPFKTAILLRFQREWPFVLYAVVLLLITVVNRKFFCKYLCPLGAALVFPAQNRLFDWVRRRPECGKPCQVCAKLCEVQAINPNGEIHKNECHYCLDCQVTYWNENKCPPLVQKRKQRERQSAITGE